ncbi:MAG: DUF1338 family protein, partial [Elusimicrobia bacterium]|nr:DUF1338 family protein [Elusimicrobiota bacterium]
LFHQWPEDLQVVGFFQSANQGRVRKYVGEEKEGWQPPNALIQLAKEVPPGIVLLIGNNNFTMNLYSCNDQGELTDRYPLGFAFEPEDPLSNALPELRRENLTHMLALAKKLQPATPENPIHPEPNTIMGWSWDWPSFAVVQAGLSLIVGLAVVVPLGLLVSVWIKRALGTYDHRPAHPRLGNSLEFALVSLPILILLSSLPAIAAPVTPIRSDLLVSWLALGTTQPGGEEKNHSHSGQQWLPLFQEKVHEIFDRVFALLFYPIKALKLRNSLRKAREALHEHKEPLPWGLKSKDLTEEALTGPRREQLLRRVAQEVIEIFKEDEDWDYLVVTRGLHKIRIAVYSTEQGRERELLDPAVYPALRKVANSLAIGGEFSFSFTGIFPGIQHALNIGTWGGVLWKPIGGTSPPTRMGIVQDLLRHVIPERLFGVRLGPIATRVVRVLRSLWQAPMRFVMVGSWWANQEQLLLDVIAEAQRIFQADRQRFELIISQSANTITIGVRKRDEQAFQTLAPLRYPALNYLARKTVGDGRLRFLRFSGSGLFDIFYEESEGDQWKPIKGASSPSQRVMIQMSLDRVVPEYAFGRLWGSRWSRVIRILRTSGFGRFLGGLGVVILGCTLLHSFLLGLGMPSAQGLVQIVPPVVLSVFHQPTIHVRRPDPGELEAEAKAIVAAFEPLAVHPVGQLRKLQIELDPKRGSLVRTISDMGNEEGDAYGSIGEAWPMGEALHRLARAYLFPGYGVSIEREGSSWIVSPYEQGTKDQESIPAIQGPSFPEEPPFEVLRTALFDALKDSQVPVLRKRDSTTLYLSFVDIHDLRQVSHGALLLLLAGLLGVGLFPIWLSPWFALASVSKLDRALGRPTKPQAVLPIRVFAQNVFALKEATKDMAAGSQLVGAYTGQESYYQIRMAGAEGSLIGHSEVRQAFHETDLDVRSKMLGLLFAGLQPIVCIGEALNVRYPHGPNEPEDRENATRFVIQQVRTILEGLPQEFAPRVIIAYEPVWAIGTGVSASRDQVEAMHDAIRAELRARFDSAADRVILLYGGSANLSNVKTLFTLGNVDGFLLGTVSANPKEFAIMGGVMLRILQDHPSVRDAKQSRPPVLAGNLKNFILAPGVAQYVNALGELGVDLGALQVILAPPNPWISTWGGGLKRGRLRGAITRSSRHDVRPSFYAAADWWQIDRVLAPTVYQMIPHLLPVLAFAITKSTRPPFITPSTTSVVLSGARILAQRFTANEVFQAIHEWLELPEGRRVADGVVPYEIRLLIKHFNFLGDPERVFGHTFYAALRQIAREARGLSSEAPGNPGKLALFLFTGRLNKMARTARLLVNISFSRVVAPKLGVTPKTLRRVLASMGQSDVLINRDWALNNRRTGESLEGTIRWRVDRLLYSQLMPLLEAGENVLVVTHIAPLRALIMELDQLVPHEASALDIATGRPIMYEVDARGGILSKRVLMVFPDFALGFFAPIPLSVATWLFALISFTFFVGFLATIKLMARPPTPDPKIQTPWALIGLLWALVGLLAVALSSSLRASQLAAFYSPLSLSWHKLFSTMVFVGAVEEETPGRPRGDQVTIDKVTEALLALYRDQSWTIIPDTSKRSPETALTDSLVPLPTSFSLHRIAITGAGRVFAIITQSVGKKDRTIEKELDAAFFASQAALHPVSGNHPAATRQEPRPWRLTAQGLKPLRRLISGFPDLWVEIGLVSPGWITGYRQDVSTPNAVRLAFSKNLFIQGAEGVAVNVQALAEVLAAIDLARQRRVHRRLAGRVAQAVDQVFAQLAAWGPQHRNVLWLGREREHRATLLFPLEMELSVDRKGASYRLTKAAQGLLSFAPTLAAMSIVTPSSVTPQLLWLSRQLQALGREVLIYHPNDKAPHVWNTAIFEVGDKGQRSLLTNPEDDSMFGISGPFTTAQDKPALRRILLTVLAPLASQAGPKQATAWGVDLGALFILGFLWVSFATGVLVLIGQYRKAPALRSRVTFTLAWLLSVIAGLLLLGAASQVMGVDLSGLSSLPLIHLSRPHLFAHATSWFALGTVAGGHHDEGEKNATTEPRQDEQEALQRKSDDVASFLLTTLSTVEASKVVSPIIRILKQGQVVIEGLVKPKEPLWYPDERQTVVVGRADLHKIPGRSDQKQSMISLVENDLKPGEEIEIRAEWEGNKETLSVKLPGMPRPLLGRPQELLFHNLTFSLSDDHRVLLAALVGEVRKFMERRKTDSSASAGYSPAELISSVPSMLPTILMMLPLFIMVGISALVMKIVTGTYDFQRHRHVLWMVMGLVSVFQTLGSGFFPAHAVSLANMAGLNFAMVGPQEAVSAEKPISRGELEPFTGPPTFTVQLPDKSSVNIGLSDRDRDPEEQLASELFRYAVQRGVVPLPGYTVPPYNWVVGVVALLIAGGGLLLWPGVAVSSVLPWVVMGTTGQKEPFQQEAEEIVQILRDPQFLRNPRFLRGKTATRLRLLLSLRRSSEGPPVPLMDLVVYGDRKMRELHRYPLNGYIRNHRILGKTLLRLPVRGLPEEHALGIEYDPTGDRLDPVSLALYQRSPQEGVVKVANRSVWELTVPAVQEGLFDLFRDTKLDYPLQSGTIQQLTPVEIAEIRFDPWKVVVLALLLEVFLGNILLAVLRSTGLALPIIALNTPPPKSSSDRETPLLYAPHKYIRAQNGQEKFLIELFDTLWERYRSRMPYVQKYEEVIKNHGATFVNDHIAFRTLASKEHGVGLFTLARIFEALGYSAAGNYEFPNKHWSAIHYEHPNSQFPKLFISQLNTWELTPTAQAI